MAHLTNQMASILDELYRMKREFQEMKRENQKLQFQINVFQQERINALYCQQGSDLRHQTTDGHSSFSTTLHNEERSLGIEA